MKWMLERLMIRFSFSLLIAIKIKTSCVVSTGAEVCVFRGLAGVGIEAFHEIEIERMKY
jgi:hypothetical protein